MDRLDSSAVKRPVSMGQHYFQRVLNTTRRLRNEHGTLRTVGLLALHAVARLSKGTVLACMHKTVGSAEPCAGRLLSRAELERASQDAGLDLPPEFVASTPHAHSQCYGVVVDDQVRCYAWTSSEAVRVVPETVVRMPPAAAYVYKAFTDAAYRRRGLLYQCLQAIERAAAGDGRDEMTTLVEIHNRASLRAFRNAGFDRCGFVVVLRRPWFVRRVGCRSAVPCTWHKDKERNPASVLGSAANELGRT
jgi:GNAT superfamily N-acetyltransferase